MCSNIFCACSGPKSLCLFFLWYCFNLQDLSRSLLPFDSTVSRLLFINYCQMHRLTLPLWPIKVAQTCEKVHRVPKVTLNYFLFIRTEAKSTASVLLFFVSLSVISVPVARQMRSAKLPPSKKIFFPVLDCSSAPVLEALWPLYCTDIQLRLFVINSSRRAAITTMVENTWLLE